MPVNAALGKTFPAPNGVSARVTMILGSHGIADAHKDEQDHWYLVRVPSLEVVREIQTGEDFNALLRGLEDNAPRI